MDRVHASQGRRVTARVPLLVRLAMLAWACCLAAMAGAQGVAGPRVIVPHAASRDDEANATAPDGITVWAERGVLQRLNNARELLKQNRYGEAARYLGAILEAPEDYFVRMPSQEGVYRGLKAEAHRLLGEMPPKGRESYELQYGARARQLLQEAITGRNAALLADVSRQFFYTQAGYVATLLLGLDDLDHGRPLAGALALRRLRDTGPEADAFEPLLSLSAATCCLEAGLTDDAAKILRRWRERYADKTCRIGGREVRVFAPTADPVAWLRDALPPQRTVGHHGCDAWTMLRGDPARNASVEAGPPLLNLRWRVPTTDDPNSQEFLEQLAQRSREQGRSTAPVLFPLAVGEVVLMRTARNLLAVDLATGKRLWEIPGDDRPDSVSGASAADISIQQFLSRGAGLEDRVLSDLTYGTLSSDGRLVFSVEDLGAANGMYVQGRQVIGMNGRRQADPSEPKPFNRLAAHDIRSGKLKWHLGGPPGQFALRQAEQFFLGPPLPLFGRLYVMAEVREEIRLLALDAETGDLIWSQQLAVAEQNVHFDSTRRLSGVSPSYSGGVLVCPTATGSVVAVELATRWLMWRFPYNQSADAAQSANVVGRIGGARNGESPERWIDAGVLLAGGRALFSPPEASDLYCVNLVDGKLLWKQPRQDDVYLACVDDERAVLVGRRKIRALNLADGQPAWSEALSLPDPAVPSGRGFLSEHRYYVPLSNGSVIAVDLAKGTLAGTVKSREGSIPGNLICHRDRILSQSIDGVESYYQIDALRATVRQRLEANPDDAEALALNAEILLDEGRNDDAVAALQRSFQRAPELRTRDLLRDALLDGLRRDFARYQSHGAEIERLLDEPQQRATFLRLMAAGLQSSGQWPQALEQYRKMIEMDREAPQMERVAPTHSVRRARWIQGQLTALRSGVTPDLVAELDRMVEGQWQTVLKQPTPENLRAFLDHFDGLPQAEAARALLIEKAAGKGGLLEAELLLAHDGRGGDRGKAAQSWAALAALLRDQHRAEDAATLFTRLAERYADVPCGGGKTGRQLHDESLENNRLRPWLTGEDPWPTGMVQVERSTETRSRPLTYGRIAVDCNRGRDPFTSDALLHFDASRNLLAALDGLGNPRWQVSLADQPRQRGFGYGQATVAAAARGHLLVTMVDTRLVAIDTLAAAGSTPRIIWSQDLAESGAGMPVLSGTPLRIAIRNAGIATDPFGAPRVATPTALGPVTEDYVCYQRFRECCAVNPLTGETLWIQHDLEAGSQLFGDEQYVFAVPPEKSEAVVLSARDGTTLGKRKLPASDQILATYGRRLLLWRGGEEGSDDNVLEFRDAWSNELAWPAQRFPSAAHTALVGQEAVGVLSRDGHFTLVSLADGGRIIDTKLSAITAEVNGFYILAMGGQYLVVVSQEPRDATRIQATQPLPGCQHRPILNGRVYAFDRHGKALWPEPAKVENQHLVNSQPPQLPLLVFGCQVFQRAGDIAPGQYLMALQCIDKRTGRTVFRERLPYVTNNMLELSGNPEKHTVDLTLQPQSLRQILFRFTFTDKPWPAQAEPEADAGDGPVQSVIVEKLGDALLRAMQSGGKKPAAKRGLPAAPGKPPGPAPNGNAPALPAH